MSEPTPWHRLFGLSLVDFFRGLPVSVELEKDLSLKQQLLDVVILRKGTAPLQCRLPDGFEDLAAHNLVSFKSYQEALDGWALNELVGHYVNYRKQTSPSMQDLLPESDFRQFAVCVRFPQTLARDVALTPVRPGIYEVRHFTGVLRLVVHELPQQEHNALLHLFSARPELVRYGAAHYRPHSDETSSLILDLFKRYRQEGTVMPDLLHQYARQRLPEQLRELFQEFPDLVELFAAEVFLKALPAEERLKGLPAEERLKGLPAEERLKGLPAEERLKGLPAEERLKGLPAEERLKGLSPDELLAALSPEMRAALAQRLKPNGATPNPDTTEPKQDEPSS